MIDAPHNVKVHFIGIGGIGMSGIAELIKSMGFKVSGSDIAESANTQKLRSLGVDIYIGHKAENLNSSTLVVYSSAIRPENPEMLAAKEKQVPVMRRAEMLAELMRLKCGVAVGGTHGKTTTTSFLATILTSGSFDPTYIIGGIVNNLKGHARVGTGQYLVAEADESDGSFLLLNPIYSIITNIDNDHMDHYGSDSTLMEAFEEFANKIPFYGVCALNMHDRKLQKLRDVMKKPWLTFGLDDEEFEFELDILAKNISYGLEETSFDLVIKGEEIGRAVIHIPGRHNVLNCLGAIAIAQHIGVDTKSILSGVKSFHGVGRRFQTLLKDESFVLIDDYGHHPTEIRATLETVRKIAEGRKVVAIFEPHRFSRTRDCWDEFLHCFNDADKVYLSPIYAASEKPISGIDSTRLSKDLNQLHPKISEEFDSVKSIGPIIEKYLGTETIIVTMGAGSIGREVRSWLESRS